MASTQQVVPVTCPNCRAQFGAEIETIINGQNPRLKSALLQGRLNVAQCPQCGFTDALKVPMLYYDLEKELAFVLAPDALTLTGAGQEKAIGRLTNTLINSLPPEQRKFYLFNPKQFLTLDSMAKAILEADGITPEMLEAQQARGRLIQELLQAKDEAELKQKIKEHDAELDREFFEILTASIQATQMEGDIATAQALLGLRSLLARWSSKGKQAIAEIDAELGQAFVKSQDELLEKLQACQNDEEFSQLVAAGIPLLDYSFFLKLTSRIDEASKAKDTATLTTLTTLRAKILDAKAKLEAQAEAALEKSANLLKEVIQSGQPDKVLAKKLDEVDEGFFMILSANIEEARRQNNNQVADALTALGNMAMSMLQARQQGSAAQAAASPKIEIAR